MRNFIIKLAVLFPVILICFAGCRRSAKTSLTIAGSTSVQPFAELLAERYMMEHPGVEINVQGGGSSAGIRAVQNRICDIGMSSRPLTPEEQNLQQWTIALDGIVLIVHKQNPVRNITLKQLQDVFSGKIRNWQELGGPDQKITVITREEGSGTRGCFEEIVMKDVHFAADALVQDCNGAVREIVASDPAAIGYISFGLVDERVQPLTVDGITPSESTITAHIYPLARKFLFLTNGEPSTLARSFLDFVLGPEGQKTLADEGLIKVAP
ncbi:phosphate ABC transporter substrate-binding protein [candidate division WOR-3 bacterium]|nr:phosphate ABC transporter substrate-binding protein [candidate division WOR-3 bacterium]